MPKTYFTNFNTIDYANNKVVDITERVSIIPNALKNPYAYYPASLVNGVRADNVANQTYNDPYLSWVVYLSNDIVDPYHEWYMDSSQFNDFITTKYGTISNATSKIVYWRNNWAVSDAISSDTYAGLTINQKDYWVASGFDADGIPVSYSRKKDEWFLSTNYTVGLTITGATSNTPYIPNEVVQFGSNGTAQVVISNTSFLTVNKLQGTLNTGYVYGTESNSNCTITAINYLSNNIPNKNNLRVLY